MLEHLVTSKARRLLLMLLFGKPAARGTAGELAQQSDVALSNAQSELKAMHAAGWLTATMEGNREIYSADVSHPEVDLLRRLVEASERPNVSRRKGDPDELMVKGHLRWLGAPLRDVEALPLGLLDPAEALFHAMPAARRNAVLARAVPVAVWKTRDSLHAGALRDLPAGPEQRHALGFMLELAGELGGDRRLSGLAETLRDRRVKSERPFFHDSARSTPFPLANKWGFTLNTSMEDFSSLFRKFIK
ncbi:MAG TPA: hypothetical protein VGM90_11865 [Kofleriaceae bacterium]|jgi:hypothetical protein